MSYRGGTSVEGYEGYVLRDKQSSLHQEQCWFTWNCLATALGNLLIFPIDMYLTCVTVSVFYFAISLKSFLSLI